MNRRVALVLYVGARGHSCLDPAVQTKKLIAIARNPEYLGDLPALL